MAVKRLKDFSPIGLALVDGDIWVTQDVYDDEDEWLGTKMLCRTQFEDKLLDQWIYKKEETNE